MLGENKHYGDQSYVKSIFLPCYYSSNRVLHFGTMEYWVPNFIPCPMAFIQCKIYKAHESVRPIVQVDQVDCNLFSKFIDAKEFLKRHYD